MRDGKGNEGAYLREVEDLVRDVLGAGDGDGSGGRRNKRVVRVFDWKVSKTLPVLQINIECFGSNW
jgi:hypothetical protein